MSRPTQALIPPVLEKLRRESRRPGLTRDDAHTCATRCLVGRPLAVLTASLDGHDITRIARDHTIRVSTAHGVLRSARSRVAAELREPRRGSALPRRQHRGTGDKLRDLLGTAHTDDALCELARSLGTPQGDVVALRLTRSIAQVCTDVGRSRRTVTTDEQLGVVQLATLLGHGADPTPVATPEGTLPLELWWPGRVSSLAMARQYARQQRITAVQHVLNDDGSIYLTLVAPGARVLPTGEVARPRTSRLVPISTWAREHGVERSWALDRVRRGVFGHVIDAGARVAIERTAPVPDTAAPPPRIPDAVRQHIQRVLGDAPPDVIGAALDDATDLSEHERTLLTRRYLPPYAPLRTVAQDLEVPPQRARALERVALRRLGAHLQRRRHGHTTD